MLPFSLGLYHRALGGQAMDLSPATLQDHLELGGSFGLSPELCRGSSPAFTRAGTS